MTDVFIATKTHRHIEKLPVPQLENLLWLADKELNNYITYTKAVKTPGPLQRKHLVVLRGRRKLIEDVLSSKRN